MKYISIILLIFLYSCHNSQKISRSVFKKVLNDSSARIHSLSEPADKEKAYFITPSGKKVLLVKYTPENPVSISPEQLPPPPPDDSGVPQGIAPPPPEITVAGVNDPFKGKIRVAPKTTFSTKRAEKFRTIKELYNELPSKETMNNLAIGRREERVPEEDRNIIIEKAYLYTITLEDDNDLHLLIGNTPVYEKDVTRVFNAEIAAIPPDGTTEEKEMIREVRRIVIGEMVDIPLCGRNNYLQAYRRITIKGSLFFDSHHAKKPAKCREVEGESAWEIHPVKSIRFFDE